ncbi:MAG: Maf family protein [Polyangiales bacterium]
MTMRRLVLASTSRYRRAQLDALGVPYVAAAPTYHEDHGRILAPGAMAIAFARGKAECLAGAFPDALILGADQTVADTETVLTKPDTVERAVDQLMSLQGRTHRLCSAIALHDASSATTTHRLVVHEMKMRSLTRALAAAYVAHDRPLDCVGSYRIEAMGALLFTEMRGDDHTAIVGLPIAAMSALLLEAGLDLLAAAVG